MAVELSSKTWLGALDASASQRVRRILQEHDRQYHRFRELFGLDLNLPTLQKIEQRIGGAPFSLLLLTHAGEHESALCERVEKWAGRPPRRTDDGYILDVDDLTVLAALWATTVEVINRNSSLLGGWMVTMQGADDCWPDKHQPILTSVCSYLGVKSPPT